MPCPSLRLLTALFVAIHDPASGQIVWTELYRNPVAWKDADEILPHSPRNVRQNLVLVFELYFEHRVGQRFNHRCHYLNRVFLRQTLSRFCLLPQALARYCVKITAPSAVTATVCSNSGLTLPC